MAKQSVKAAARQALADERQLRKQVTGDAQPKLAGATIDSFVNFAHRVGLGADNALSTGSYGFNPITRNRVLLEWIHRGSWLGGVAVDCVADDMTKAGIEYESEFDPKDAQRLDKTITSLGVWDKINECIKWGRLYGGAIAVAMIEGQDPRTPLRVKTVAPGQFKGLVVLDRWMLEPSLEDLVTEEGPNIGLPKYYRVNIGAPYFRGQVIHYSRVMVRHCGVQLPYQQALTESMWGISVIERLYDRMVAFDSASMGAAQLIYKAHLRTLKIKELRNIIAAGGKPYEGLISFVEVMRRFQGQEGITLLDGEDEFEVHQGAQALTGIADALDKFGEQVAGALQVPLVRLLGQSPAGLSASGESDMRNYYDSIGQRQEKDLRMGVHKCYQLAALSRQINLPDDFDMNFRSLWELDEEQKANVAKTTGDAVSAAFDGGLIGRQTALRELRQSSRRTGIFSNITEEQINAADDEVMPPMGADVLAGMNEGGPNEAGSEGEAGKVPGGPGAGKQVRKPAPPSGQAGGGDRQGDEPNRPRKRPVTSN